MSRNIIKRAFVCGLLAASVAVYIVHAQTNLTFHSLTIAGATYTEATGYAEIDRVDNLGEIVGFYIDSSRAQHGFSELAGKVSTINFPQATATQVNGIDLNAIYIVGTFIDSLHLQHGFKLDYSGSGEFTRIDFPGAVSTRVQSVNSDGTLVGSYTDKNGSVHGFIGTAGAFRTVDFPNAVNTQINSIVNLRYMAASFVDSSGVGHGAFGSAGKLDNSVDVPEAKLTAAKGINDGTEMVGYYGTSAAGPFHGFTRSGGLFITVDYPNAIDTRCNAIGGNGEIVGRYTDASGKVHGFFARPPLNIP